jgi:hypothetical protein
MTDEPSNTEYILKKKSVQLLKRKTGTNPYISTDKNPIFIFRRAQNVRPSKFSDTFFPSPQYFLIYTGVYEKVNK